MLAEKVGAAFESQDHTPSADVVEARDVLASRVESLYWPGFPLATRIREGVAFHHADLRADVRALLDDELREGAARLEAIVATTTLAEGVNLPFRSVVFHHIRVAGGLPPLLYRNVIGRAARAFRSTEGLAIFLESEAVSSDWIAQLFWRINRDDLSLESPSARLAGAEPSIRSEEASLALDSQIIGHIGDGTIEVDDTADVIVSRTLASFTSPEAVPDLTTEIAQRVEGLVSGLDVPVAMRSSPARLTDYGRACLRQVLA